MEIQPLIPSQIIEEIRNKTDIVTVVSEYVKLRKTGRNYVGLCPFHSEKTPSFTVSPEKQLFHCFGCREGGNVFTFLMKTEGLGFNEAVAELGNRAGITVEKTAASGTFKGEKDKLYEVTLLAAKFFRQCYEEDSGRIARDYVKQRGINEPTAKIFGVGFAPAGWDHLFKHLLSRGAAPGLIAAAGLTLSQENQENKDKYYDRFRNRLIFPVCDPRGRVIAFSGRALAENEEPKYMNSPDTPIYHKGETVFGLNLTKESVKKEKKAILVEGNFDLMSVYQAGITNAAAPLGTALTAPQCKLLARFTDNITVAFDS
ncbi:DNA primase, partial [Candidatus Saganbacteria bacterium]|nr:DNA primase [Candidatus Saganbacteria bacterium]